jgi:iron(III) transport system substrate-binding protein
MSNAALRALIAAGAALCAGHAARAAEWDDVVAAARKEGAVTVYHAQLGAPHWKKVVADFEAKYGIKVGEFDARASEMTERVRVEQTSSHFVADAEFHGDSSIIQQRQTNFVEKLGPIPNEARLRPEFKRNDYSIPAWNQVVCMLANTNLVKPQDEPKEWKDLLDPKWKGGKILTDDMRAVGSGQTVYAVLTKHYGDDFTRRLAAQEMGIGRDLQDDSRKIARGEYPIFINQIIAFASPLKGLPVKVLLPSDGCPFTPIQGAVLHGAPHPNAARLFINHLLDLKSQTTYAEAWMGTTTQGVVEALSDPDAKRFAQVKTMGSIAFEDRDAMLKSASELFK